MSVFDFAVEKTFDGADVRWEDADPVLAGNVAVTDLGVDACGDPAGAGGGIGLDPPMLRVIVCAGGGASVC